MPRLVCTMDADNGGRCVGSQFRGPHRKLDATMINLRFFLLLNLFVFFSFACDVFAWRCLPNYAHDPLEALYCFADFFIRVKGGSSRVFYAIVFRLRLIVYWKLCDVLMVGNLLRSALACNLALYAMVIDRVKWSRSCFYNTDSFIMIYNIILI